jgi:hypothetical protein
MLNDPLVASLARHWAEQILKESPNASRRERIEQMYESALCREPSEAELKAAEAFIDGHGELLAVPPGERDNDVAIWSELAHVLFNHKEFLLRN